MGNETTVVAGLPKKQDMRITTHHRTFFGFSLKQIRLLQGCMQMILVAFFKMLFRTKASIYIYIPLKRPNNFFQKLRCLMPKTKQQQKKWHVWLYGSSTLHVNDVVFICPVMRTPVFGGVLSLPLTVFCGYFVAPQRSWSLPFPSNGGSDHDLSAW